MTNRINRRHVLKTAGIGVLGISTLGGTVQGHERSLFQSSTPVVLDSSIRHLEGTQPDMDNVQVDPKERDTSLMVHVEALDQQRQEESEETLPEEELLTADLAVVGADHTTTFEIEIVVESFTPRLVNARCRGVDWERDFRSDGTVAMTIVAKPGEKQINSADTPLDDWPEGEEDQATHSVRQNVSFAIYSKEEVPEQRTEMLDGTVIGSNAQVSSTPGLRSYESGEELEIIVAAPHYTVDGDVFDGYYYAILPRSLLDAWEVTEPNELEVKYEGDESDIRAQSYGDGILIEVDVHYSVVDLGISSTGTLSDDETIDIADAQGDDIGTGFDDEVDQQDPNVTDPGTDQNSPDGEGDATGEGLPIPGFGAGVTLAGLGGVGYLLKRRTSDDTS